MTRIGNSDSYASTAEPTPTGSWLTTQTTKVINCLVEKTRLEQFNETAEITSFAGTLGHDKRKGYATAKGMTFYWDMEVQSEK